MKKPASIDTLNAITVEQQLPEPYSTIIRIAMETGFRISDILRMKKKDYSAISQDILIQESKTKKWQDTDNKISCKKN